MLWRGFQKPKRLAVETETLTDKYGKFSAQPFERGFGTTIGNALRRTLLSSIEGAAVTAVAVLRGKSALARRLCLCGLLGGMRVARSRSGFKVGVTLGLVVRVSLTSPAPATMPLPFTLSSRLNLIRLSFWLVLLCCHACTSRCVGCSCSFLRCDRPWPEEGRDWLQLMFPPGRWPLATSHALKRN